MNSTKRARLQQHPPAHQPVGPVGVRAAPRQAEQARRTARPAWPASLSRRARSARSSYEQMGRRAGLCTPLWPSWLTPGGRLWRYGRMRTAFLWLLLLPGHADRGEGASRTAPPATPAPAAPTLTPAQAQAVLDVLHDDKKRAEFTAVLENMVHAVPAAPAKPAVRRGRQRGRRVGGARVAMGQQAGRRVRIHGPGRWRRAPAVALGGRYRLRPGRPRPRRRGRVEAGGHPGRRARYRVGCTIFAGGRAALPGRAGAGRRTDPGRSAGRVQPRGAGGA